MSNDGSLEALNAGTQSLYNWPRNWYTVLEELIIELYYLR